MRAAEFVTEAINPDILNPGFKHSQQIGDYTYTAEVSSDYGDELIVRAFDGKDEIGKCEFEILGNEKFSRYEKDPRLVSNRTWVDPVYRDMGIATTMYAYAKMLGNDIMPHEVQSDAGSRMWQSWNQSKQSKHILPKGQKGYHELTEIERLSQYDYSGGKGELGGYKTPGNKMLKPLPGGSGLQYAIKQGTGFGSGYTYIFIVDPKAVDTTDKPVKHRFEFDNEYAKRLRDWSKREGRPGPMIVAKLSVAKSDVPIPNAVQVGSITVDEDYRGQGLAKALYGIVLSIMGKTLVAGGEQTPGGRRNWLSLVSIPGVEVKGFVQFDPEEITFNRKDWPTGPEWDQRAKESEREVDKIHNTIMKLGGQFVAKDRYSEYWAFDVVPGRGELKPAVKTSLSQIYDSGDAAVGLFARWVG